MNTFIRKPVRVYAKRFDPKENPDTFIFQTESYVLALPVLVNGDKSACHLSLPTAETIEFVDPGNWVVQDTDGKFLRLTNEQFNQQYEPENLNPAK